MHRLGAGMRIVEAANPREPDPFLVVKFLDQRPAWRTIVMVQTPLFQHLPALTNTREAVDERPRSSFGC